MAEWRSLGLDFVTLRVFKAAVEERSFVGAAEREHLAASAISRRIAELEARLGVELLRRHDRGVEPTPAGRLLMRHVESLFNVVDVTLSDLESLTKGHSGEVRICASLSMISSRLPQILGRIRADHPGLDLKVEQKNSEDTLVSLCRGTADVGFVSGVDIAPELISYPFFAESLFVVVPQTSQLCERQNGLRLADLDGSDYVSLRTKLAMQQLVARKAMSENIRLHTTVIVDGFDLVAKYVEMGMGVAIMPQFHAAEAERGLDVVAIPLVEDWAMRTTHICTRPTIDMAPAAKIVLQAILADPARPFIERCTA